MQRLSIAVIFFYITIILSAQSGLGVNLTSDGAFANIVNHTNRYKNAKSYDKWGWPESDFELLLMDGRPVAEWSNSIDDPEEYRIDYSGTYKSSFKGMADITLWGSGASIQNQTYDSLTNTTTFELVIPGPPTDQHGIVNLIFSNTQRDNESPVNSGITSLKVMRPGYELNRENPFTDEYIALCKAANFDCYRYYNLQNIWSGEPQYPEVRKWEERKTPQYASQTSMKNTTGNLDAWSWDYIVELSNILDKDIWICIPLSADEEYVKELASYLKDNLNPDINIYVENSNELWSPTHMTHGPYNNAQADELGITFMQNHARKTVELSQWFADVFGSAEINNRIRVIMAGQHAYFGRHQFHLDYIENNFGAPNQYIYALSTALYFNTENPEGSVNEILSGMENNISKQISDSNINTYRKSHIDLAEQYGFVGGCTSYEGGPHYPAGGSTDNLNNAIISHRTEKMGEILAMNYDEGWKQLGGGLAMHFTLASAYTRFGCWGLTDDYTKPYRNHKMQAIKNLIDAWNDTTSVHSSSQYLPLVVYPNPTHDYIFVDFSENIEAELNIYNMNGKKVMNTTFHNESVDVSNLENGSYIVVLKSAGKEYMDKLIISK